MPLSSPVKNSEQFSALKLDACLGNKPQASFLLTVKKNLPEFGLRLRDILIVDADALKVVRVKAK